MVQASGTVNLTVGQVGLHLINHHQGWGPIPGLVKYLTHLLAGLMKIGAGNTAGIDGEDGPVQVVAQPFHDKRFATAWRAMEDNGGGKVNPERPALFCIFNNVNHVLI